MENRNFKLDTEWNMIHYSEKPNGFGILIIGDERHFVDEQKSFWLQNEGKLALLNHLRNSGYTVFYSNLYGKHWGSKKAVMLAEILYQHMMRTEILNTKIHIIAEGIGAMIALDLMNTLAGEIRSVVFINPVFSLKFQLEQEKEHKFFYKKLLREISHAYNWKIENVEQTIMLEENDKVKIPPIPMKIIHFQSGRRSYNQFEYSKQMVSKWEEQNQHIQTSFFLPEKKQQLGSSITKFLHQSEKDL